MWGGLGAGFKRNHIGESRVPPFPGTNFYFQDIAWILEMSTLWRGLGAGFKGNHMRESRVPPPTRYPFLFPEASYSKVFLGPRINPKTFSGIASAGYTMDPRNGYRGGVGSWF